jgi:acetyl-CoA carboxylase carboxyl transferase subunit alpha
LTELKIVDDVVPEPVGGAHRDYAMAGANLKQSLSKYIQIMVKKDKDTLLSDRLRKYRVMGVFSEP